VTAQVQQVAERLAGPENGARRTVAALLASALSVLPLSQTFTDWAWLPPVWIAMLLAIGPAALLRTRWAPRSIHLLPGLVLALLYLTVRFVPDHAWGGIVPLRGAWLDVAAMNRDFHDTIRDSSAPLQSTEPVRMVLAALLVLLAVAVDLVAVVARRPALAGVPFLLLYTLAGAMPRHAVGWFWFALAALGYLLLLSSDARDERSRWGRLMPRPAGASKAAVKALTARRIAVIAIVVALAVPLVLPVRKSNLLADALHGGPGSGSGGGGVSLDPFVRLKGQLNRKDPVQLLEVDTAGLNNRNPFYLGELVLDRYDASGWRQGSRGATDPVTDSTTTFVAAPNALRPDIPAFTFTAKIMSVNLDDVALPLFQAPTQITGLTNGSWVWSRQQAALVGGRIQKGDHYTETVVEPQPSISQLKQSKSLVGDAALRSWLEHPNMPNFVRSTVDSIIKGKTTPYDRARAILDYFVGPNSTYTYSLSTKAGDSGNDLTDFLHNQFGFCQQFAGAMGIMLRMAGVPSRVVVGYTHSVPDTKGRLTVTTNDAHAWVEGYFDGIGWLPFDPTPLVGTDAGRAAAIPWAPKAGSASGGVVTGSNGAANPRGAESNKRNTVVPEAGGSTPGQGSGGLPMWATWLLVGIAGLIVLVFLVPAGVRLRRRRRRLRAAARDPDPLWRELADTAVDLGYVWSPVRTPRQVVKWLRREGVDGDADGALRTLANAVELSRYAAPGQGTNGRTLVAELRRVEVSLRSTRTGWERTRARLLPLSLGWTRIGGRRRH
jgi:transglutaminase-like putative cysteine protease